MKQVTKQRTLSNDIKGNSQSSQFQGQFCNILCHLKKEGKELSRTQRYQNCSLTHPLEKHDN